METLSPISSATGVKPQQTAAAPVPATPVVKTVAEQTVEAPSLGQRAEAAKKVVAKLPTESDVALPERHSSSLKFIVDGNRVITTIVDDQSKKVVVQIPDAELIRIAKSIDRMQGFFIEQKA